MSLSEASSEQAEYARVGAVGGKVLNAGEAGEEVETGVPSISLMMYDGGGGGVGSGGGGGGGRRIGALLLRKLYIGKVGGGGGGGRRIGAFLLRWLYIGKAGGGEVWWYFCGSV